MRALERGEIGRRRSRTGRPPGRVSRLPRLRAGLPLGCGLWPRAGSRTGAALRRARGLPPLARAGARSLPLRGALAAAVHPGPGVSGDRAAAGCCRAADGLGSGWECWRRRARTAPEGRGSGSRRRSRRPRPSTAPLRPAPVRPSSSSAAASWTPCSATCTTLPGAPSKPTDTGSSRSPARAAAGRCTSTPAIAQGAARWRLQTWRRSPRQADFIVVNSAGCGALLKDYGHLLGTEAARELAAKVRDVSELLADAGPRAGGAARRSTWPTTRPAICSTPSGCKQAPLAMLGAIPGLRLRLLPGLGPLLRQRGHLLRAAPADGARRARQQDRELAPTPSPRPTWWSPEIPAA